MTATLSSWPLAISISPCENCLRPLNPSFVITGPHASASPG